MLPTQVPTRLQLHTFVSYFIDPQSTFTSIHNPHFKAHNTLHRTCSHTHSLSCNVSWSNEEDIVTRLHTMKSWEGVNTGSNPGDGVYYQQIKSYQNCKEIQNGYFQKIQQNMLPELISSDGIKVRDTTPEGWSGRSDGSHRFK